MGNQRLEHPRTQGRPRIPGQEPGGFHAPSGDSLGHGDPQPEERIQAARLTNDGHGTHPARIRPYLLVGIGLGAAIHGWAPEDFFATYAGADNPFAVLIAVLVGVPLYSNAAGILPLVDALYAKGLPMGTLLAFMMATVALSLPEMILLRRVLKPKLIAVFVSVTAIGIIGVGYLFNAVL